MTTNEMIYKVIFNTKKDAKFEQEELKKLGYEVDKVNGSRWYFVKNKKTNKSVYVTTEYDRYRVIGKDWYFEKLYYRKCKLAKDICKIDFVNYLNTPINDNWDYWFNRVKINENTKYKIAMQKIVLKKESIKYKKQAIEENIKKIEKLKKDIEYYKNGIEVLNKELEDLKKELNIK